MTWRQEYLNILAMLVQQNLEQATGKHFNLPWHSKSNLTATILEHVKVNDIHYRKDREHYHIRKFNTVYGGLNLKP